MHDNKAFREMFIKISMQDKKIDDLYRRIAAKIGLSESAFWCLYGICETDEVLTQNTLVERMSIPKQTVNSAIINLVRDGLVRLEAIPSAKNSKGVLLTEKGRDFCGENILPLLQTEDVAYSKMTEWEILEYIELCQKQYDLLNTQLAEYLNALK